VIKSKADKKQRIIYHNFLLQEMPGSKAFTYMGKGVLLLNEEKSRNLTTTSGLLSLPHDCHSEKHPKSLP